MSQPPLPPKPEDVPTEAWQTLLSVCDNEHALATLRLYRPTLCKATDIPEHPPGSHGPNHEQDMLKVDHYTYNPSTGEIARQDFLTPNELHVPTAWWHVQTTDQDTIRHASAPLPDTPDDS